MRTPLLIVIDVQEEFNAATDVVLPVVREILRFSRMGWPIFFVEYKGFGPSHKSLYTAVGDSVHYIVTKSFDDGSEEVAEAMKKKNIEADSIVLCGVNTCYCVKSTISGLIKKLDYSPRIELYADVLSCEWHSPDECYEHLIDSLVDIGARVVSDER